MSFWNPEQIAAAHRSHIETSFVFASKTIESVQKVVELNLESAKSAVGDTHEAVLHAISAKHTQDWAGQAHPAEHAVACAQAYFTRLHSILTSAQAEFAAVATEHYAEHQRRLHHWVDDAGRNVPTAAEPALSALKSAIHAAGVWYESTRKAAQQAIEVAENNVEAASSAVPRTAKRGAESAERPTPAK